MSYRIEFLTEDRDAAAVSSALDNVRYTIFLHAVAAARSALKQWERPQSTRVVVNIFDRQDRLTSRLQLAASELAAS